MTFDLALLQLRAGHKMGRSDWGTKKWLQLHKPGHGKPPKLRVHRCDDEPLYSVIWVPKQRDLLAEDWFEIRC